MDHTEALTIFTLANMLMREDLAQQRQDIIDRLPGSRRQLTQQEIYGYGRSHGWGGYVLFYERPTVTTVEWFEHAYEAQRKRDHLLNLAGRNAHLIAKFITIEKVEEPDGAGYEKMRQEWAREAQEKRDYLGSQGEGARSPPGAPQEGS